MAGFTTDVSDWTIVRTGIVQGLGLGFIFVPLSTITFATLRAATAAPRPPRMFSLMRNIGSSIGISIVVTPARPEHPDQPRHARRARDAASIRCSRRPSCRACLGPRRASAGLAALNDEITRQAATIAYLNDFRLMMYVMLLAIPMLLLLRKPRHTAPPPAAAAVAE